MSIESDLARRIRDLRQARGHTLARLAELSGVSRSMISLIEREESSPTAAVLNRLADALGVTLASLFSQESPGTSGQPLTRRSEQQVWKDPASGYERRHLSPNTHASPLHLVEVTFPPGKTVAFEHVTRNVVTHQQVWLLEGEMKIAVGDDTWRLRAGDCLAMVLGPHIVFENPTRKPARYLVALTGSSLTRGKP